MTMKADCEPAGSSPRTVGPKPFLPLKTQRFRAESYKDRYAVYRRINRGAPWEMMFTVATWGEATYLVAGLTQFVCGTPTRRCGGKKQYCGRAYHRVPFVDVVEIRARVAAGEKTQAALAREYKISQSNLSKFVKHPNRYRTHA